MVTRAELAASKRRISALRRRRAAVVARLKRYKLLDSTSGRMKLEMVDFKIKQAIRDYDIKSRAYRTGV